MKPEIQLYLSDARGVYLPRDFADDTIRNCVEGVSNEDWQTLKDGPDGEWYWEAWISVCDNAVLTDPITNVEYRVEQDGDCWLIPVGMEWNEEEDCYDWPSEED